MPRYAQLKRIVYTFLWLTILVSYVARLLSGMTYLTIEPRGATLWMMQSGTPLPLLALAAFAAAVLGLFVPMLLRRRLSLGLAVYILSSVPTLFYIYESYYFAEFVSVNQPSVGVILNVEAYLLLLILIGFMSFILLWLDNASDPHEAA